MCRGVGRRWGSTSSSRRASLSQATSEGHTRVFLRGAGGAPSVPVGLPGVHLVPGSGATRFPAVCPPSFLALLHLIRALVTGSGPPRWSCRPVHWPMERLATLLRSLFPRWEGRALFQGPPGG